MSSLLPVYYQIKNKIQEWIVSKEYLPGEKLPSENELAKIFKVSRLTVRQAISVLDQEKLVFRKRGEGTFVTNDSKLIDSFGLAFSGFMDDLFYQVSKSKTKSVEIERVKATKSIQTKLEIDDEYVYRVQRVRLLNNLLFAFTVNYLPELIGSKISKEMLMKEPMLKILEVDLGYEFDEAFQTIEASFSDQDVSDKLEIPSGSPILFVERIMYDKKSKPIEFVQTSYRGDIYKYVVRMKVDKADKEKGWVQKSSADAL